MATGLAVLLLLLAAPAFLGRYGLNLLLLVMQYTYLGSCWNLVAGFAGQFSLAHATFFGLGGYVAVYLFRNFAISPWMGLLAGAAVASPFAAAVGFAAFRYGLRGSYFAIATLAVSEITRIAFSNVDALGGGGGMTVPLLAPGFAAMQFGDAPVFYYVSCFWPLPGWAFRRSRCTSRSATDCASCGRTRRFRPPWGSTTDAISSRSLCSALR